MENCKSFVSNFIKEIKLGFSQNLEMRLSQDLT